MIQLFVLLLIAPAVFGLQLASSAFTDGGRIPGRYTCEGQEEMPPLAWSEPPEGCKSLVLTVVDPDAPDPARPQMEWIHFLAYNLPPRADSLSQQRKLNRVQPGLPGFNSSRKPLWQGPCPPVGRHRYIFTLYALDTRLMFSTIPDYAALMSGVKLHTLAEAQLTGTYQMGDLQEERDRPPARLEGCEIELEVLEMRSVLLRQQGNSLLMPSSTESVQVRLTDLQAFGELGPDLPVAAFVVEVSWGLHVERELVLALLQDDDIVRLASTVMTEEIILQRLDFIDSTLRLAVYSYREDDKPGLPTQESLRYYSLQNQQLTEDLGRRKFLN